MSLRGLRGRRKQIRELFALGSESYSDCDKPLSLEEEKTSPREVRVRHLTEEEDRIG